MVMRVPVFLVVGALAALASCDAILGIQDHDLASDASVPLDDSGADGADARADVAAEAEAGIDADADAGADAPEDAADATDGMVVGDAADAADAADVADSMDAADAMNAADATDGPDATDGTDGADASDAADASDGGVLEPPSCALGGLGMTDCGGADGGESCCTSLEVEGGTYYRTYVNSGDGGTGEADPATVSGFRLDKYEVTVGRFRQFVTAVMPPDGGVGWTPPQSSGKHTHLNSGMGLADGPNVDAGQGYEQGWSTLDNGHILPTNSDLGSCTPYSTWTNTPSGQENLPINCENWWEAYAFCIWDGGFLPSEAEWEYAAGGGNQQREYPWGTAAPGTSSQYAIYNCYYDNDSGSCNFGVMNIAPVGTPAAGAGVWGQLDLAGSVVEWNLDWYAVNYASPCTDCAYLNVAPYRAARSSGWDLIGTSNLLPANRSNSDPQNRFNYFGIRCARTP
jgi:sulfatase modifying factor 1